MRGARAAVQGDRGRRSGVPPRRCRSTRRVAAVGQRPPGRAAAGARPARRRRPSALAGPVGLFRRGRRPRPAAASRGPGSPAASPLTPAARSSSRPSASAGRSSARSRQACAHAAIAHGRPSPRSAMPGAACPAVDERRVAAQGGGEAEQRQVLDAGVALRCGRGGGEPLGRRRLRARACRSSTIAAREQVHERPGQQRLAARPSRARLDRRGRALVGPLPQPVRERGLGRPHRFGHPAGLRQPDHAAQGSAASSWRPSNVAARPAEVGRHQLAGRAGVAGRAPAMAW